MPELAPEVTPDSNSQTTPGIVNYEKGNQVVFNPQIELKNIGNPKVNVEVGQPSAPEAPAIFPPAPTATEVTSPVDETATPAMTESTPSLPEPSPEPTSVVAPETPPESATEPPPPTPEETTSPTEAENPNNYLEKQVSDLTEQVKALSDQVAELVSMQKQLLEQNQQLMEQNKQLKEQNDKLLSRLWQEGNEDGKIEASMIATDPEEEETEDAGAPPEPEPGEDPKKRFRNLGKWFRHPVHSTFAWFKTRGVGRDKEGKPIVPAAVIVEGEPITESDRKRRCLLPVLGALAVGVGAGYLLSKYGVPFIGDGGGTPGPEGLPDNSGGGHIEVFNKVDGDRSVQSILPDNLIQERTPAGIEHIVDKNTGQEVIDHVTYGENGRYSVDTIRELKDHGYDVGTKKIEIFDTTGPGPRGDITHKVSEVTSQ